MTAEPNAEPPVLPIEENRVWHLLPEQLPCPAYGVYQIGEV